MLSFVVGVQAVREERKLARKAEEKLRIQMAADAARLSECEKEVSIRRGFAYLTVCICRCNCQEITRRNREKLFVRITPCVADCCQQEAKLRRANVDLETNVKAAMQQLQEREVAKRAEAFHLNCGHQAQYSSSLAALKEENRLLEVLIRSDQLIR